MGWKENGSVMAQVLLAGEGLVEVEYAEAGDGQGRMLGEGQFFVSLGLADAKEREAALESFW